MDMLFCTFITLVIVIFSACIVNDMDRLFYIGNRLENAKLDGE